VDGPREQLNSVRWFIFVVRFHGGCSGLNAWGQKRDPPEGDYPKSPPERKSATIMARSSKSRFSVNRRAAFRAVIMNKSIRFVPSFLLFGPGGCPGRKWRRPLPKGPNQKVRAERSSSGTTLFGSFLRFLPFGSGGVPATPSGYPERTAPGVAVSLRRAVYDVLFNCQRPRDTEHPRAKADGHACSHEEILAWARAGLHVSS
jgi:hypothetical protein